MSLEEKVRVQLSHSGVEDHEFQESLSACLSEGRFLLLIVGDRVSPNIALLSKAIQSAPGLGFTLGLAEIQLYEMEPGKDWPLVVVPEVVGRTVERTRGVVRVRYQQEKPTIEIAVDDDPTDGTDDSTRLTLDGFLKAIPPDLVAPYKEFIAEWEQVDGKPHVTDKMVFFETELSGRRLAVVRCRTDRIAVVSRKKMDEWGGDSELYDAYLNELEGSPPVAEHARSGKFWLRYDGLKSDDLRVLFQGAIMVAKKLQANE